MQKFTKSWLLALFLLSGAFAQSSWLWHPVSSGFLGLETLFSVAWTGNRFVSVGYSGLGMTSTDGAQWSVINLKTTQDLTSVIWTGTQAVAVGWGPSETFGYGALALTSPDGLTWTGHPTGSLAVINALAWTGTQIVGVGQGGTILTSPDGISWTARASGTTGQFFAVAVSDTQIVAVGANGAATSRDGVSWILRSQSQFTDVRAVTWTGSQFVALTTSGRVFTSPTGASWTSRATGLSEYNFVTRIGDWVVSVGSGPGSILASTDAVSWSRFNTGLDPSSAPDLRGIACSSDTLCVVVGNIIATTNQNVYTSIFRSNEPAESGSGVRLDRSGRFLSLPALEMPGARAVIYTITGGKRMDVRNLHGGGETTVSVEGFQPGWYVVEVRNGTERFAQPFEIRR